MQRHCFLCFHLLQILLLRNSIPRKATEKHYFAFPSWECLICNDHHFGLSKCSLNTPMRGLGPIPSLSPPHNHKESSIVRTLCLHGVPLHSPESSRVNQPALQPPMQELKKRILPPHINYLRHFKSLYSN